MSVVNKILGIVIVVIFISVAAGLCVRYGNDALKARKQLEEERYTRMVSEESLQKATSKITSLETELDRAKDKVSSLERTAEQLNAFNTELKTKLDSVAVMKDELEKKAQELSAAVGGQSVSQVANAVLASPEILVSPMATEPPVLNTTP